MVRDREALQQKLQAASADHSAALQRLVAVASVVSGILPSPVQDSSSRDLGSGSQPDLTSDQRVNGSSVPVSTPALKTPKHPRNHSSSPVPTTPSRQKPRRLDPVSSPEHSPLPLDRAEPSTDQPEINDDGGGSPDTVHGFAPPADLDPVGGQRHQVGLILSPNPRRAEVEVPMVPDLVLIPTIPSLTDLTIARVQVKMTVNLVVDVPQILCWWKRFH